MVATNQQKKNSFLKINKSELILHLRRTIGNRLDLIEQSPAQNLVSNAKRIFFSNATIIPKVFITKFDNHIQVLVATTYNLHRFQFPINIKVKKNLI